MALILIACSIDVRAQSRVEPVSLRNETQAALSRIAQSTKSPDPETGYRLGPDDEITIEVLEAEEFSGKRFPVGPDGDVRLPLVGPLHAEGLTLAELEEQLATRLSEFIRDPNATVTVAEYRSQPVSVIGAVASPGVHQLRGRKTLIEILSLAGGVRDDAGPAVKITRRLDRGRIPLPEARDDSSGGFSVAEVNLPSIVRAQNPAQNIYVEPNDIISVPRAEMVYVVGAVARTGGYVLGEKQGITALEALALAGGLASGASAKGARILRPAEGASERLEIAVDLRDIMAGRSEDVPLRPDDILFVPTSGAKAAAIRAAEAALGIGSGVAIWRVGAGR